jgi:DNA-binding XRE family transcriptional regulator
MVVGTPIRETMELPPPGPAWSSARRRSGLSQERLAGRVGITSRTLRNLERPGCRDVTPAIRRVVAIELWLALGGQHPFTTTEED